MAPAPATAAQAPAPAVQRNGGMTCNGRLFQIANLELRVQAAMLSVAEKLNKERQINVTPECFQGMVGRAFIQLAREGYLDGLPYDHLLSVAPKAPPPAQPATAPGE